MIKKVLFILSVISVFNLANPKRVYGKSYFQPHSIFMVQELKCFPNPFINQVHVVLNSDKEQDVQVKIFGSYGKLEYQETISLNEGDNEILLEPHLKLGIYYLSVQVNSNVFLTKKIRKVEEAK